MAKIIGIDLGTTYSAVAIVEAGVPKIIENIETNNPHYLIEVKLHSEAAIGKINGALELYTNSKIQPVIRIPIIGEIEEG